MTGMQVIEGLGTSLTIGSATIRYVTLKGWGVDGGDALNATALDNTAWVTKLPQTLKELPDITFTAIFDPAEFDDIVAEVNVNQQLVMTFSYQGASLGTFTFWGYLKNFDADEGEKGVEWKGGGTIVATNLDAAYAETAPRWDDAS